jgi:hypothetical protein
MKIEEGCIGEGGEVMKIEEGCVGEGGGGNED